MQAPGTSYRVEVNPRLPHRLQRLEELAGNLWYSWDRPTRELFERLHPALWEAVGQNPKAFLRQIDEQRLREAGDDPVFCANLNRVLSAYDTYHAEQIGPNGAHVLARDDLVAYFCAEFGFHESLPIYSGGLGILAGDHCKAASDVRVPLVGVGLLYRQGYFFQTIDGEGNQQATYADSDFEELPITLLAKEDGTELRVSVEFPERLVSVRIWKAIAGHVSLYLLDTDVAENAQHDRGITYRLYGGDASVRLDQEIVLGRAGSSRDFDMTALAVRGSRFQNGVSRIHGEVSARMSHELWPQLTDEDIPIAHIANGVHVPTFLSPEWTNVFDRFLGAGWAQ